MLICFEKICETCMIKQIIQLHHGPLAFLLLPLGSSEGGEERSTQGKERAKRLV
jgi:hypothetical protein